jgi:hypothetical protein
MFQNFENLTTLAKVKARGKVIKFKKQLDNADRVKVELNAKGKLVFIIEKDCTCEPDEVGTGVMEEFTETHTFEVDINDIDLTSITADN